MNIGRPLTDFTDHRGAITSLRFHPSELVLASSSEDRTVHFYDVNDNRLLRTTAPDSKKQWHTEFSADSALLYVASDDKLRLYDTEAVVDGAHGTTYAPCLETFTGLQWSQVVDLHVVNATAVQAEGEMLFAGCLDGMFAAVTVIQTGVSAHPAVCASHVRVGTTEPEAGGRSVACTGTTPQACRRSPVVTAGGSATARTRSSVTGPV